MQKFVSSLRYVDSKTTDDDNAAGKLQWEENKAYRLVKNAEASTAFVLGDAVYHKLSDGADMSKNAYIALTANLSVLAGIVVATNGIAAASYGWVQVFGMNDTINVSGATTGGTNIAAGDYLKGVTAVTYLVRDAATQPAYKRTVQAVTAVGTTTTPAAARIRGFISCL